MDIVKIGFVIQAGGLEKANKEVDALLDKVGKISTEGKKSASDFENSQKKMQTSNRELGKEVDKTSKALEKQRIIGDYLGKGLDKSTATSLANFKLMGASVEQLNKQTNTLLNNKGLVQTQKDLAQLQKQQEQNTKIVQSTVSQYEKLSSKGLGGGILDTIDKQNKGLNQLNSYYKSLEASQTRQLQQQKNIATAQERTVRLSALSSQYKSQGFTTTNANKLASFELSGASAAKLQEYRKALIDTQGGLQSLGNTATVTAQKVGFLNTQVGGIAKYAVLSAIIYGVITAVTDLATATVKMADEYTTIQNRMKLYITDADTLTKVNQQLTTYSMENNVGLKETASLYARLAPAMQKIGANTAAVTSVVDAFGKSMRIGGATTMEATAATIQFSQAMASGKLQGDEFRSLAEASPRFLKAIADGSGIAAERLKEMSSAGMLTTEVISKALLKEYPKLIAENKALGISMEQGANAIKTGFLAAIGEFNEGAGITKALGGAMYDLAESLYKGAQNARQFGKDIREWFKDNAAIISGVTTAFQVLALTLVSKYVAGIVLARVESIRYQASLMSMAAAQNGVTRSSLLMSTAITGVSKAMQGALAFFGGWAGLALTVAGVAGTYLLLRDNAGEANRKLAEQSEYLNLTTSEFEKLNAAQKENARLEITLDLKQMNKNLDEAKQKYLDMVDTLTNSSFGVKTAKQAAEIADQVKSGTISFDDATSKLVKLGAVTDSGAKKLIEQTKQYNNVAQEVVRYSDAAKTAGVPFELAGNAAQNANPLIQGTADALKEVGDEARIAGNGVSTFATSMKEIELRYKAILDLRKKTGLDSEFAGKTYDAGVEEASKQADLADQNKRIIAAQTAIVKAKSQGVNVSRMQAQLDKTRADFLDRQAKRAVELAVKLSPDALRAQNAKEADSDYTKELRDQDKLAAKAEKDAARKAKKAQEDQRKAIEGYQDQINAVMRLENLLAQGVDYETAKIASEKEYAKYVQGTGIAQNIIAKQQEAARLEYMASLGKEAEQQKAIYEFVKLGVRLDDAKTLVSNKLVADSRGRLIAENLMTNALSEQLITTQANANELKNINTYLSQGYGLEQATLQVTMDRLKALKGSKLDDDQLKTAAQLSAKLEELKVQNAIKAANQANNDLTLKQTMLSGLAGQAQANALADILVQYEGINLPLAKTLLINQSIVDKLTEYNTMLEQSKSLTYNLANVDFSVFGDFGNPFQSALEGLNNLIFGMDDLDKQYKDMFANITERMSKEKEGSDAYKALIAERGNLEAAQIEDKKKAQDKAIASGLSLTKSLFKEESKGYKVVSALEKAYQASKIAFALWEKKDTIAFNALKLTAYVTDALGFTTGAAAKIAAQETLNVAQAKGAIASSANAPFPLGFAAAAAMMALLAGVGIAISGGGSSGTFEAANTGTGTVFGDTSAESASIKNSIDKLKDNSDLMLPISNKMLAALNSIVANISGLTNLIIQGTMSGDNIASTIETGFKQNFIGSVLSFIPALGNLFGKKVSVQGSGLYGSSQVLSDIMNSGYNLQEYADIQTKKKFFGVTTSTKNSTVYSAADQQLADQFTKIFTGFYQSILAAAPLLDQNLGDVENSLKNFVVTIGKIDLTGLSGTEIQERLEAVFSAAADNLASAAIKGLVDFQKVGEGYYETVIRVAASIEEANYYTQQLGVAAIKYTEVVNKQAEDIATEIVRQSYLALGGISTVSGGMKDLVTNFSGTAEEITTFILTLEKLQTAMYVTGQSGDYLTSAMINGAGGLDKLNSGLEAYFDMLSDSEKATELTRRLTDQFAALGLTLPSNTKSFRDLVKGLDLTTAEGQKLYGQVIALAPEFNDLQDALEKANSEVNKLVSSLRDLAEQARQNRGESESTRNLAYLRYQFEQTAALAMNGDTTAAGQLSELGKLLMTASKTYATSTAEYMKDLATIQKAATVAADVQEAGLGYTPTLSTSSTTTSTPTVNTDTTTTDAKIDSLNETMVTGFYTLAKTLQDMASRFERWDYGDRMLVRVEQDNDADNIPVRVITP